MDIQNKDYIATSDINISSYLLSTKKVNLIGIDRDNPKEIYFRFIPKETVQILIDNYWLHKAEPIQPRELFSSLRDLKDLIFERKK